MGTRKIRALAAAFALVLATGAQTTGQTAVPLSAGMVIDRSVTIRPGVYRLASTDLEKPAITIRGENVTIDFNGATLAGGAFDADPDSYTGTGILIDGGSNVTLKNAVVRGYKVGILARNSADLHLTRNDVSYNWKQRLHSGIEKESLRDWMSYHNNEKGEWLRFGAGIYLRNCDRAEIDHNTALQGQNGLMVTHSKRLKIWNNTFQFLSSLGIGLYRVSESTIMHNRIDWCVRGYSHGFYNRGQDSAGLLMYEQSSNNTVAYNSITHGGDGLFLWAGQSTMDSAKGGSNDNLFYENDFSHAPTNGIETTFSRNQFVNNRVEDNWHGVWGGYSYESLWQGNRFLRNAEGITIEHGQDNVIQGNTFEENGIAIRLWQNATQDPNWGYPKNRDTRSRNYTIRGNSFARNKTDFDIKATADVERAVPTTTLATYDFAAPARMAGGIDPMLKPGERRGRDTIIVDEWGPYDWKSPKLWPVLPGGDTPLPYRRRPKTEGLVDGPLKLNVLGPPGAWRLISARGATAAPANGKVGEVIAVTPTGPGLDYEIVLEYRGAAVTSPRGAVTPAGRPHRFGYRRFFAPANWTVRFFEYPEAVDMAKDKAAFAGVVAGPPVKMITTDRLEFLSGGVVEEGVARDRFAVIAEGRVALPPGDYTLQVVSDDGVRVWVDGTLVVEAWDVHESRVDTVPLRGGTHTLKVEYFEATGWAELQLELQPRRSRK